MILVPSGVEVLVVVVSLEVKGWKNVLTNSSQCAKGPSPRPEEEVTELRALTLLSLIQLVIGLFPQWQMRWWVDSSPSDL